MFQPGFARETLDFGRRLLGRVAHIDQTALDIRNELTSEIQSFLVDIGDNDGRTSSSSSR